MTAASVAAVARERTASGVRRWRMPCSETVTAPSASPAVAIPASANANTGANATRAKPAPMSAQPPTMVTRSFVTASRRPANDPPMAPPPQQATRIP